MDSKVEKDYENFWKALVENEDGSVNIDAVKAELSDYKHVLSETSKVYSHATGGELGKTNYFAHAVIPVIEEHYHRERSEYILDDLDMGIVRLDTFDDDLLEDVTDWLIEFNPTADRQDAEAYAESLFSFFRVKSIIETH